MSHRLPDFHFHSIELHLDEEAYHQELYQHIQHTRHHNRRLGTRIWWGVTHRGESCCIKEFFRADPVQYRRRLPDPIWRKSPPPIEHTGRDRGLRGQRARSYDERTYVPMDTATLRAIGQDDLFRDHFNAYAFELDALITQFAQHYGYRQIVQAYRWGSVVMEEGLGHRGIVEMERLQPLPLPRVGDYLSIVHRVLEMMSAVTQLHAMAIPVRCYPPELVRDLELAQQHPITRSFHYDLSPDQFLLRPSSMHSPEQVVLIDFNSSRMAHAEYSNFFWYAIPGKDYFQPPERRRLHDYRNQNKTFQSSPVYDLYSLLTIALFYLLRQQEEQTQPSHLPGWESPSLWQKWLRSPDILAQLKKKVASNRGIDPGPILELIAATLPHPPQERRQALLSLSGVDWSGLRDWMLVPKAMNAIARYSLGREFQIGWHHSQIDLIEGESSKSLHQLLDARRCIWQPGLSEQGRIDHPPLDLQQIYFIQDGESYPIVRNGRIEPIQAGHYKVFAVWRGCVDFANPLHLNIQPYRSSSFLSQKGLSHATQSLQANPISPRPALDATIVEEAVPAFSPEAFADTNAHTLGTTLPVLQEQAPSKAKEQDNDAFWATPVPNSLPVSPSSHTAHDSHEEHLQVPSHSSQGTESEASSLPSSHSGKEHPYREHLPTGSTAYKVTEMPGVSSADDLSATPTNSMDDWLTYLAECRQHDELNRCEDELMMQFESQPPIELIVQLHTRRCELAMTHGDLSIGWPSLNMMVHLLRRENISKLHTGILLNNLTVYCYMWAWKEKRLPLWDTQVGLDPLSHLRHWLQLSEPPGQIAPPQMRKLRKRSRETIICALHVKQALQSS